MDSRKFFEELVSRLVRLSGNSMVVHTEKAFSSVRRVNEEQSTGIGQEKKPLPQSFEYGRFIDYEGRTFYLSIRSKSRIKSVERTPDHPSALENDSFPRFLENTMLELFAADRVEWSIGNKLAVISLKRYYSEILKTEDAGIVLYKIGRLLLKRFNRLSGPDAGTFSDELEDESISDEIWTDSIPSPAERKVRLGKPAFMAREVRMSALDREETHEYVSYPVLYGTNRKKKSPGKQDKILFGEERDNRLNLGKCEISIPKHHRQGELERPNWFVNLFFRESPEKHFTILENEEVDPGRFAGLLKKRFEDSGENDVLLFIHGFNTRFEEALYRTAQLGYDLCFRGAVTAFSWPSRGKVRDYVSDTQSAEYSIPFLSDYIRQVLSSPKIGKLHIIAHSMGNVVLCGALKKLNSEGFYPNAAINRVILAAPDIDRDVFFMQIMPAIKTSPNITLYACDKDNALKVSKGIRSGYVRLGEGGSNLLITEGLDSVDASEVDMSMLGHTYFAETPSLLNEIHMVLENLPPGKRMLKECTNAKKQKYWILKRT